MACSAVARWWAGFSTTTIRPAPGLSPAPRSGGLPGATPRRSMASTTPAVARNRSVSPQEGCRMSTDRTPSAFSAERLAEKICAFDGRAISRKALAQSRDCILDTVGVTLAGVPEDATRILLDTPGVADAPGPALVFGTDRRTSTLDATLVNGTASHALDYDDFSGVLGGHQSVPLVPMLFALGEERRAGGRDVLTAYVVGVETEIRLARAVNFHHYDKGWHPTATLGIFGTTAAAARLLRLDKAKTATALAIAASLASGLKANFGTMVKPLHVGHCARNGLL